MARFDFIEASSKGYKFLWEERHAIARLGFPAAMFKFVGFVLIMSLGWEGNALRHGLVFLPAFFAEGWLLSHLIRKALYNENLPFTVSAEPGISFNPASQSLLRAGMAVYVLTWLILSLITGLAMIPAVDPKDVPEPSLDTYFTVMIIAIIGIWLFRLIWLFVPVVMGYSIPKFLGRVKGYAVSLYLVGTWLVCYLPFVLILMMFSDMAILAFPSEDGGVSKAYEFVMAAAKIIVNIATTVTATIAVAYGVQSIMSTKEERK